MTEDYDALTREFRRAIQPDWEAESLTREKVIAAGREVAGLDGGTPDATIEEFAETVMAVYRRDWGRRRRPLSPELLAAVARQSGRSALISER